MSAESDAKGCAARDAAGGENIACWIGRMERMSDEIWKSCCSETATCRASALPSRTRSEPGGPRRAPGYARRVTLQEQFDASPRRHRRLRRPDRARRDRGRAPARGPEPAPARGGRARRGPAAGPRRRRLGQDPGPDPPDRLPARHRRTPGRARSSRSPSPTRPPRRCASGSASWSAARCGRCG